MLIFSSRHHLREDCGRRKRGQAEREGYLIEISHVGELREVRGKLRDKCPTFLCKVTIGS